MKLKNQKLLFIVASVIIWISPGAKADIPMMIPYGGTVAINGESYTGDGSFRFAIVNEACVTGNSGCITLWSNDGKSEAGSVPKVSVKLPVTDGSFSVKLGDTNLTGMPREIPVSVFENNRTYLRVWFDDGLHGLQLLNSDRQLVSVPYAYRAKSSDSVALGSVGGKQINKKEVQARIQACEAGTSIESVNDDGSTICISSSTYSAGEGLLLSGKNDFSIDKDILAKIDSASAKSIAATGGLESVTVNEIQTFQIDASTLSKINQTGDIYDVKAGAGLSGGGASGDVTLSVDFSQTQARVSTACTGTQKMRGIGENGTPICASDIDSTIPNTDALADLKCNAGQIVKIGKFGWQCDSDDFSANTDVLAALKCSDGQIAKYNDNSSSWKCSSDITNTGDITGVTTASDSGLLGGGLSGSIALSVSPSVVPIRAYGYSPKGGSTNVYLAEQKFPGNGAAIVIDVTESVGFDSYRCIKGTTSTLTCNGVLGAGNNWTSKEKTVSLNTSMDLSVTVNYSIRARRTSAGMFLGLVKTGDVSMSHQISGGQ